jgi:hypothetical protein
MHASRRTRAVAMENHARRLRDFERYDTRNRNPMLAFSRVVPVALLALICAHVPLYAQIGDRKHEAAKTISADLTIDEALIVLELNGCNRPYGLDWAKPRRDQSYRAFQIDDGVILAIIYSDVDKSIFSMQMIFTPPELAKSNDRRLAVRTISFEPDGTYLLHILKQGKQEAGKAASPTPQLPKHPLPK